MANSGEQIVNVALQELNNSNGTKYGADPGELWCSEFVSWVYWQAGYPMSGGPYGKRWHLSNVSKIIKWFNNNSTFTPYIHPDWWILTPSPGDYVCFGNNQDPYSHSGIVKLVDSNDTLHTIEGNSGLSGNKRVREREYTNFRTNRDYSKWVQGLGLRYGKQIRIPNGSIVASSSSGEHQPDKAFDQNTKTWWQSLPYQINRQFIQMNWNDKKIITKIDLDFGDHFPTEYRIKIKYGISPSLSFWRPVTLRIPNTENTRSHIWFKPIKSVYGVRLEFYRHSNDDYFSLREMAIQR